MWAVKAMLLLFMLPLASARQNTSNLRAAQSLGAAAPRLLVLLGKQKASCQCAFDDECSCKGALKFMDCIKKSCDSGECQCIEPDGTNHFTEACQSMEGECSALGLKCSAKEATCNDKGVAWHSKLKETAVEDDGNSKAAVKSPDPKKYVLHTKYSQKIDELHSHGHRTFAQGVITTLLVLSVTVAMASSSNAVIAKNTWSTIDFTVVTFLALSWFIVVNHSFDYFKLTGLPKILAHMTVAVLFLLTSTLISWRMFKSGRETSAGVFNGIFTPMVMWCNAGLVETVHQERVMPWAFGQQSYVFLTILELVLWYIILAVIFDKVVSKLTQKGWNNDTENHMAAGALAGASVLWLHMVISGSYQTIEDPHDSPPSLNHTLIMNGVGFVFLGVAIFSTPPLMELKKRFVEPYTPQYWKARVCDFMVQFVSFLPRFSFVMSLAHLIVDNLGYSSGAVAARLHLALASTFVGVLMILLSAKVKFFQRPGLSEVLVGMGGFMVGVAWSGVLDNSINMMVKGEGYAHPFQVKLAITGFITLFVFPVYFAYLKPVIDSKTG